MKNSRLGPPESTGGWPIKLTLTGRKASNLLSLKMANASAMMSLSSTVIFSIGPLSLLFILGSMLAKLVSVKKNKKILNLGKCYLHLVKIKCTK